MSLHFYTCPSQFLSKSQANEDAMEKLRLAKQSHEQFVKKKDGYDND